MTTYFYSEPYQLTKAFSPIQVDTNPYNNNIQTSPTSLFLPTTTYHNLSPYKTKVTYVSPPSLHEKSFQDLYPTSNQYNNVLYESPKKSLHNNYNNILSSQNSPQRHYKITPIIEVPPPQKVEYKVTAPIEPQVISYHTVSPTKKPSLSLAFDQSRPFDPNRFYNPYDFSKDRSFAGLMSDSPKKELKILEEKCDDMYDDIHILRNSLIDRVKLEENLQIRNRELENEVNILRRSKSPVIAYKVEEIQEFIPVFQPEAQNNKDEKVKKAKKVDNEEVLRLRTEIMILQEELEKERKGPNFERLLKEFYEKLCGLSEDFRESQERARDMERDLAKHRERHKEKGIRRIKALSEMINNLRNVGNIIGN